MGDFNLVGWVVLKSEEQDDSKIELYDALLKIRIINSKKEIIFPDDYVKQIFIKNENVPFCKLKDKFQSNYKLAMN